MNLFEETDRKIHEVAGKTWGDITWIGISDKTEMWDDATNSYIPIPACEFDIWEFIEVANTIEYDAGYGTQEINKHLVIVFEDGSWLERAEYDGSEWWEYKDTPQRPGKHRDGRSIKDIVYRP